MIQNLYDPHSKLKVKLPHFIQMTWITIQTLNNSSIKTRINVNRQFNILGMLNYLLVVREKVFFFFLLIQTRRLIMISSTFYQGMDARDKLVLGEECHSGLGPLSRLESSPSPSSCKDLIRVLFQIHWCSRLSRTGCKIRPQASRARDHPEPMCEICAPGGDA